MYIQSPVHPGKQASLTGWCRWDYPGSGSESLALSSARAWRRGQWKDLTFSGIRKAEHFPQAPLVLQPALGVGAFVCSVPYVGNQDLEKNTFLEALGASGGGDKPRVWLTQGNSETDGKFTEPLQAP